MTKESGGDPVHWTMVCLMPDNFFPSLDARFTICQAPNLRAQSAHLVAHGLELVVSCWTWVLGQLELLLDSGEVLRKQDQLQDILFDDDAFSTSKRYFWEINFIHEVLSLIDNAIEQWIHYRQWCIIPWKKARTGREAYWYEQSQEVLERAEKKGGKSVRS